jgi:hypothetical protein
MLKVSHVDHNLKEAMTYRFFRAARKEDKTPQDIADIHKRTHLDGELGEWGLLVSRIKQRMQGHFPAEDIAKVEFDIR